MVHQKMSEVKRFLGSCSVSAITLVCTVFLWQQTLIVVLALGALSVVALMLQRSRTTAIVFIVIAILGPFSEAIAIYYGAWHYTRPHFLGAPLWLPLLWGNAGVFVVALKRFLEYLPRMRA